MQFIWIKPKEMFVRFTQLFVCVLHCFSELNLKRLAINAEQCKSVETHDRTPAMGVLVLVLNAGAGAGAGAKWNGLAQIAR